MMRIFNKMQRFRRSERGSATIEVVMAIPIITLLMSTSVEIGLITARQVMLDRALDLTVRDIRLGASSDIAKLTNDICDRAVILPECHSSLMIELQPLDEDTWSLPDHGAPCYDRKEDIRPPSQFTYGAQHEIMLVRACVIIDPAMPWYGMGAMMDENSDGQFYLKAVSAFVNEPA